MRIRAVPDVQLNRGTPATCFEDSREFVGCSHSGCQRQWLPSKRGSTSELASAFRCKRVAHVLQLNRLRTQIWIEIRLYPSIAAAHVARSFSKAARSSSRLKKYWTIVSCRLRLPMEGGLRHAGRASAARSRIRCALREPSQRLVDSMAGQPSRWCASRCRRSAVFMAPSRCMFIEFRLDASSRVSHGELCGTAHGHMATVQRVTTKLEKRW